MNKNLILIFLLSLSLSLKAQTGWNLTENDALATKLSMLENTPNGNIYLLTYDYNQAPYSYKIRLFDSTGTQLNQVTVNVSGGLPSIRAFLIDTVQQRLLISTQTSDAVQFNMHLKVMDYNLTDTDSASFSLLKTSVDSLEFFGGGIDNASNKFLIYRYRDLADQIWGRGICRKNAAGTYKTSLAKAGQASNDGYTIRDFTVTPSGNIFIGGSRKESLYGNFFFLEKLNSSMTLVFEIKDQLIPGNFEDNHVSSLHVYTTNTNSQVVVSGTMYGLAPGDTMNRCHGVIRCYTYNGNLKWNYQTWEVRDFVKSISKSSYVHSIGNSSNNPSGYDTKIYRLFLKDGVLHWQRYFGNKSKAVHLQVENDGSLIICGDKQYTYPLQGGGTLKTRSYMLLRYSKYGKKLFDFNFSWNLPFNPTQLQSGFTDIVRGRSTYYYAAGFSHYVYNNGGTQTADSILLQQFSNGSLRMENGISDEKPLSIHPNPARESISFELPDQVKDIQLTNNSGVQVAIRFIQNENTYTCDISGLAPGMYLLSVQTESVQMSSKFIKE